MNCAGCGQSGRAVAPMMPWEDGLDVINKEMDNESRETLLIELNDKHYCFPCHCQVSSVCFQCWEEADTLYRDDRCKNNSYVCAKCVKRPIPNHKWTCYGDGCMTPEEVAQEEYEIMMMEAEG